RARQRGRAAGRPPRRRARRGRRHRGERPARGRGDVARGPRAARPADRGGVPAARRARPPAPRDRGRARGAARGRREARARVAGTVKTPWWLPPVFGRIPPVDARLLSLLGLVSLALFFESYDYSMGTSALRHIAADLGIAERDLGETLGLIRLGAVPAF